MRVKSIFSSNDFEKKKINILSVENIGIALLCLYILLLYLNYVTSALATLQTIALYGSLGMALVMVVLVGKVRLNRYLVWYLVFSALGAVGALFSSSPSYSLGGVYLPVVVFAICFSLSVFINSESRIKLFMGCLVAGSVMLFLYLAVTGGLSTDGNRGGRLGDLLTGNANNFASVYMAAAFATVYMITNSKRLMTRLALGAAFIAQIYCLILSGGRKFFLLPFIVLYVMLLFKADKNGKKHMIINTVIGIVVMVTFYQLMMRVPFLYDNIGYRFESFYEYSVGNADTTDGSTLERELMRETAIKLWMEKPIFGHGLNMFSKLGGFGVYSHCNYTELLCNHGIVGTVYYYSFFAYLIITLIRKRVSRITGLFFIGVSVGTLFFDYGAVSYFLPISNFFVILSNIYLDVSKSENDAVANGNALNENNILPHGINQS